MACGGVAAEAHLRGSSGKIKMCVIESYSEVTSSHRFIRPRRASEEIVQLADTLKEMNYL
jgi:hypothetical protein